MRVRVRVRVSVAIYEARAFLFDLPDHRAPQRSVDRGDGEEEEEDGDGDEESATGLSSRGGEEGVSQGGGGNRVLAVEVRADRFLRRMVRILVREGRECLCLSCAGTVVSSVRA